MEAYMLTACRLSRKHRARGSFQTLDIDMKKEQSFFGIISVICALAPVLGLIAIHSGVRPGSNIIRSLLAVILFLFVYISPVVGLIFGALGMLTKAKSKVLPSLGTMLCSAWLILLIWGNMSLIWK